MRCGTNSSSETIEVEPGCCPFDISFSAKAANGAAFDIRGSVAGQCAGRASGSLAPARLQGAQHDVEALLGNQAAALDAAGPLFPAPGTGPQASA